MAGKSARETTLVRPGADAKRGEMLRKKAGAAQGRHNQPRGSAKSGAKARYVKPYMRDQDERESLNEMLF